MKGKKMKKKNAESNQIIQNGSKWTAPNPKNNHELSPTTQFILTSTGQPITKASLQKQSLIWYQTASRLNTYRNKANENAYGLNNEKDLAETGKIILHSPYERKWFSSLHSS